ncbi:hypothetical protein ACOMCU_01450 [Lysinibacillus sp. UGB7]|uniref:hypothetical protein n=1 Tax=Lysinibacillus sp. UGB7 TaxID=3411039 RepID=UPI003B7D55F7
MEKKSKLFIASDHTQHDTFEEAEWHEFITDELKIDALAFDFPQSNCVMTLKSINDLERFLAEEYEGCELIILNDFEQMEFPNRYVMMESVEHYGVENRLVKYTISFIEMNDFKRTMIDQIMSL